ncbi:MULTISPECIES: hypothetical protein [unclassified Microbacterium]|uniref:hypothetical protein n=1 Tax=unclassified Microbacterium TaxID=2609290 RepID=UPI002469A90C|nr:MULTISPECIES: hypothetical protein [unclassified Microbacterium]MDH5135040.1 hypothetical protein [Microbacterium sp. RD10]MDH5138633.1 hypothetical protein [Microbacterium sp. RD11]MDH5147069.1 hypothetical protein [Microbacterium sp. RD12]MDH5156699.1 hypothetical protein [Microbacterium sp. RD06]MDH5168179.1 hypothetical protein [Microbacterium sp. RD02]
MQPEAGEVVSGDLDSAYPAEKISDLVAKTGRIDGMWSKEQIATHALTLAIALKAVATERDEAIEHAHAIDELSGMGVSTGLAEAARSALRLAREGDGDGRQ